MGRVKNTALRALGNDLISKHKDKFTKDFEQNKKAVDELKKIDSKRVRNILAGYITNEMKKPARHA